MHHQRLEFAQARPDLTGRTAMSCDGVQRLQPVARDAQHRAGIPWDSALGDGQQSDHDDWTIPEVVVGYRRPTVPSSQSDASRKAAAAADALMAKIVADTVK